MFDMFTFLSMLPSSIHMEWRSPSQSFVTHICRVYWGADSRSYRYTYRMKLAIPFLICTCIYMHCGIWECQSSCIHVYKSDGEGAHPISCIYMNITGCVHIDPFTCICRVQGGRCHGSHINIHIYTYIHMYTDWKWPC